MSQYQRNKRELLKDRCLQYLGGKRCCVCGIDYLPPSGYDFHHRSNKSHNVSEMIGKNMSWKLIRKELDKCVVVCKNHHAMITAGLIRIEKDNIVSQSFI